MHIHDFIKNHVVNNRPILHALRPTICETLYQTHLVSMKNHHHAYIMNKFFDHSNQKHRFVLNEFPYRFESHTIHYMLWINPMYSNQYHPGRKLPDDIDKYIFDIIENPSNLVDSYLIFENTRDNRTIKNIKHFHIIFYN